jgi:hypothetical protein
MFCARCDQPLKDSEAEPLFIARPTGPELAVYVHRTLCRPDPSTSPVSWPTPIREG